MQNKYKSKEKNKDEYTSSLNRVVIPGLLKMSVWKGKAEKKPLLEKVRLERSKSDLSNHTLMVEIVL